MAESVLRKIQEMRLPPAAFSVSFLFRSSSPYFHFSRKLNGVGIVRLCFSALLLTRANLDCPCNLGRR